MKTRVIKTTLMTASAVVAMTAVATAMDYNKNADATNAIFSVSVSGVPAIEVTLNSQYINLDMTPTQATADFDTGTFSATVATSNTTGYSLLFSVDNTYLANASGSSKIYSLVENNGTCPNGYTNGSTSSGVCTFTADSWGYKLSTASYYKALPSSAIELAYATAPTDGATTSINVATKVSSALAAGVYEGVLNFTAVANPNADISSISNMQDFKALSAAEVGWIKQNMTEGVQYRLKDTRDNKYYYISKLNVGSNPTVTASRDSNKYQIWMTQNLDLDLSTSTTLNSDNTDLNYYGASIYTNGYTATTSGSNTTIYWTPGDQTESGTTYYATTQTAVSGTKNTQVYPQSFNPGNVYYYQNASASTSCNSSPTCNHWHAGNYYNWTAAVASNNSTNQSTQYQQAENSICPAGWRLPSGPTASNGSDFGYLLLQQGISTAVGGTAWATNGHTNIQGSPLFFPRSGYFGSSALNGAASYGIFWSSSSNSATDAYYLGYNSGSVGPANNGNRYSGFSVRCVARE